MSRPETFGMALVYIRSILSFIGLDVVLRSAEVDGVY